MTELMLIIATILCIAIIVIVTSKWRRPRRKPEPVIPTSNSETSEDVGLSELRDRIVAEVEKQYDCKARVAFIFVLEPEFEKDTAIASWATNDVDWPWYDAFLRCLGRDRMRERIAELKEKVAELEADLER